MDTATAKVELLSNHFQHALQLLTEHLQECGNVDGLLDIRRLVEAVVDAALARCKPQAKLSQRAEMDDVTGRLVIGVEV